MAANVVAYIGVSLCTRPTPLELAQAERFVGLAEPEPGRPVTPGVVQQITPERMEDLVAKFMGRERAAAAFQAFFEERGIADPTSLTEADRQELTQLAERLLSGAVGTASAQAIMEGIVEAAPERVEAIVDLFGTGLAIAGTEPRGASAARPRAVAAQRGDPADRQHPRSEPDDGPRPGAAPP